MTKLVIASGNEGKVLEFRSALKDLPLTLMSARNFGLNDFPPEDGATYAENALVKARYAAAETGLPSLGDDSGLEVAALNGAPGLYSARYGGLSSSAERLTYLLAHLQNIPESARDARFVCALALATPSGEFYTFQGECAGQILHEPRGADGFGYDPVFYSLDLGKTFAEANASEKERVSHRGRALEKFKLWFEEFGNGLESFTS